MQINRKFSIAPMMDKTDRHERFFLRSLTKESLLYTEMIHCNALIHGNREELLKYDPLEHPVAIQLGGSEPDLLSIAAVIAEEAGFDEINLNVGCPSSKVQSGMFGAILMKNPLLVTRCIVSMKEKVTIPVTVKCRIGVDEMDEDKDLYEFINAVKDSGCKTFIIHARKAWLKGLSPKDNREIPPLNYQRVYKLKEQFPDLEIIINGGISNVSDSLIHFNYVDGVMMGRAAYDNPFQLGEVDKVIYGKEHKTHSRKEILRGLIPYMKKEYENGNKLSHITKHLMGLYKGTQRARMARNLLANIDRNEDPIQELITMCKTSDV